MKKTVYFTSDNKNNNGYNWTQIDKGIKSAVTKRDLFLQENEKLIGKIDNEDISFVTMQNNQVVMIVIKLTYYPK